MLEGLLAWFLNTYVGEYVENLNTDQLSIGLLQGQVELENLPLKKDALKYLGLPVEIRAGFIGKIHLHIPIYRLRSEPWVINIEKLYVVAGKVAYEEYDEEKEEAAVQCRKLSLLDAIEEKWKAEFESQEESYYAHSYLSWLSYGTSLMSNVIENLQLNIKDIHIRYEDELSSPSSPLACGILIHYLTAQSTDEYWVPKFVTKDKANVMCKLVEIGGLAVYWDTEAERLSHLSPSDMMVAMQKLINGDKASEKSSTKHEYILEPVGIKAQLKHNCSSKEIRSRRNPRLICDLQLEKFCMKLNQFQYRQMTKIAKEFERLDIAWKYRKWRPNVPVKENPRKWWQFAIQSHLETINKERERQTWDFLLRRSHNMVLYYQIYHNYLLMPDGLSIDAKAQKDELEQELEFDELCILRGLVMDKIQKEHPLKKAELPQFQSAGLLQRWFPGWKGWYSSTEDNVATAASEESSEAERNQEIEKLKSKLEEELLGAFESDDYDAILQHDRVCAQLNFSLMQSTVTIMGNNCRDLTPDLPEKEIKPIIEFELFDVETTIETRPRRGSLLFSLKLGAMYLHDRITPNNVFPCLVAPQNRENNHSYLKFSAVDTSVLGIPIKQVPLNYSLRMKKPLASSAKLVAKNDPLFELTYDRKPLGSSADHRLIVNSLPLDVVYNPTTLRSVINFFSFRTNAESFREDIFLETPVMGRTQYEAFKSQTKAEIRQKLDEILEGEQILLDKSCWEINLAISAPEIIVPEDFQDPNGTVVVFDLGKLHFYNAAKLLEKRNESSPEEEEEDFITPCSTPPKTPVEEVIRESDIQWEGLPFGDHNTASESDKERNYERYTLNLNDMQILVSQNKDNWRFAQSKGTSTLHVLDRFSVSLQMERQLISTKTPNKPNITIYGKLPKLVLHVSEQKVEHLQTCLEIISSPLISYTDAKPSLSSPYSQQNLNLISLNEFKAEDTLREQSASELEEQEQQEALLFLMCFCVDEVSVEIQSRGRSIVELQVTGVKTTFSKHSCDTSVTLCVHSLLLVDALQTFGPDFELLIASHRNVCMDSMSGSLHGSEHQMRNTLSPIPSSPPQQQSGRSSPFEHHQNQLFLPKVPFQYQQSPPGVLYFPSYSLLTGDIPTTDALIMVEFTSVITQPTKKDDEYVAERSYIASVQFNSLDITGNQETIVELIDFLKRIFTNLNKERKNVAMKEMSIKSSPRISVSESTQLESFLPTRIITRTELTFDFHRLNILLLRALNKKNSMAGQKVATATMSGARFEASIGTSMQIQGALSGFQVLDLITERNKHQRILSVGQDPLVSVPSDITNIDASKDISVIADTDADNTEKAFSFTIRREFCKTPNSSVEEDKINAKFENETLEVRVRMASLFYIHSPRLLCELSSCATEFKEYMAILASSIKSAAAEVAIGIMSKRIEVPSVYGSMIEVSPHRKQFDSSDRTTYLPNIFSEEKVHLDLKLDMLLHTPVIVFPSAPHNASVLVAHLGQITVQNDSQNISSSDLDDPFASHMVAVEISDMNLYSLNTEDNIKLFIKEVATNYSVQDIYNCSTFGQAILHNTIIKVNMKNSQFIENSQEDEQFLFGKDIVDDISLEKEEKSIFQIYGYVVNPLKVVLTKSQYEQLMNTLDNITYFNSTSKDGIESKLIKVGKEATCVDNISEKLESESTRYRSYQIEKRLTYRSSSEIHATFVMSDLTIELVTDCRIAQHSLVLATFKEFILNYEQDDAFIGNIQVTLQSLMVEDLLQLPESKHRYLMKSTGNQLQKATKSSFFKPSFLSTSCPNIIGHATKLYMDQSCSLPDHLSTQNAFNLQLNKAHKSGKRLEQIKDNSTNNNQGSYPNTPPPSPSGQVDTDLSENALVHINITLVDRHSCHHGTKYNHIDRFIDANFNCLETTANMKTWIMVLDFFKNNAESSNKSQNSTAKMSMTDSCAESNQIEGKIPLHVVNSKIEIRVRSLTLVLCKQDYELAKANISSFGCCIIFKDNNISTEGKLGSASVVDLTPYGKCYPERFITSGDEALHFDIFKYGDDDWDLMRVFDVAVKFRMCSVRYIHTNRFYMDIMNFIQNFFDIQDMLHIHSSNPGNMFHSYTNLRRSRIKMDVAAGSPVIIIPQSFSSSSVLVANLGKLTVHNVFLFAGSPGTISTALAQTDRNHGANKTVQEITNKKQLQGHAVLDSQSYEKCLLDVMFLELSDIDLYAAVRLTKSDCETKKGAELIYSSFIIKKEGSQLLEKFMLKVQVERNLHSSVSHFVPDMIIKGTFSSLYFTIDLEQYKLIRGVLSYNLGEEIDDVAAKNVPYQQTVPKVLHDQVWTTMAIHLELVNVTVDIVSNHCNTACVNSTTPLAKFDFIRSRLSLEIYSDNTKDIDLISHEIRVSDSRYKDAPVNNRPNVFTSILQPTKESETMSLPQAELHYIVKHNCISFIISLNCMRVMSIFDWSADVLKFLCCELDPSVPLDVNKRDLDTSSTPSLTSSTQVVGVPVIIKLYLTDTEVVVVEDPSLWDTNSVILKTTASLKWTPRSYICPMMCEFRSMEVFSCILGIEEETALSIIDPVSFTIEIVKTDNGILQLTEEIIHLLKIKLENLNLRLSYHDVTMFIRILESFTRQTGLQYDRSKSDKMVEETVPSPELLALEEMGYKKEDCIQALTVCNGDINDAAVWLTANAPHNKELVAKSTNVKGTNTYFSIINLQAMLLSVSRGCLCIIDDCRDSDVPLLEVTVTNLEVDQAFTGVHRGNAIFVISTDYYNRALSGWEPFIEPWRCNVKWNFFTKVITNQLQKISFEIEAEKTLNINITAALLDLYRNVKENWVEEYYKTTNTEKTDLGHESTYRRRSPFVPFAIRNDTGCKLWFATTIAISDKSSVKDFKSPTILDTSGAGKLDWMEVHVGQVIPFSFGGRDKLRHKDSHRLRKHQLIVKIDGWQQLPPVSVDQVGVFFRFAMPQLNKSTQTSEALPTRLVYSVTLEGSARKLITVRSGLLLTNKCDDTMEMKMENVSLQCTAQRQTLYLVSHTTLAIPLPYLHSQIWIRPVDKAVVYSSNPILWQHVVKPGAIGGELNVCKSVIAQEKHYRISVCVKRERYLTDCPRGSIPSSSSQRLIAPPRQLSHQPGHKIFLIPPAKITNLLPYELHYIVKDKETQMGGYIKPGNHAALHNVDVSDILTLEYSFENFQKCNELIVRPSSREFLTRVLMYDNLERLLVLQARVIPLNAGAMKINISSPYWLINKSGLPLVFRQEGTQLEAAGQSDEHELARSVVPLLFSFADRDASAMCTMRIGHSLHSGSISHWCNRFHLEKGIRVRHLHVTPRDTRPDWVYTIGIDIRMGRGRYHDTYMVTLSPRYQLDNRSSHKLEYIQKFGIDNKSQQYIMSAMPKCKMPFHWPRVDLDNLLCVRLADIPDCMWSGGFSIDKINSFHINMRDGDGRLHFLRVEILLNGATYYIIFTDADKMPPPLRIDNLSEVSIIYYQTNVKDERLKTSIRPGSCVPYALDEPTLPSMITCSSPGGSTATYNMNKFGDGDKLYYRNFIYLAFKGTFLGPEEKHPLNNKNFISSADQNLVLDVVEGTRKVILNKKEPGKRSQLWRMAITGLLHHEGSSPPQDPRKKISSKDLARTWVLDIAGLSPLPGIYVPLMLRKPDERRRLTQTWHFTEDGRLCCDHPNMFVQPRDGFYGLIAGNEAVLGPSHPVIYMTMSNDIPFEQAIVRQKLRGGSGVLSVKVIPDGPTRVLQISDLRQKQLVSMTSSSSDWVVVEENGKMPKKSEKKDALPKIADLNGIKSKETFSLHIFSHISGGIGISLINRISEELVYICLHNIMVEYNKTNDGHSVDGSIQNIQVDNQLREAERPVLLFVTPPSKKDHQRHLPALHITCNKISTKHLNAEIFKHLIITVKGLSIQAEEKLIFKLLQFAGYNQSDAELEKMEESDAMSQRALLVSSAYAHRYYFNTLKLSLPQVRLSVLTSGGLSPELQHIKKKMGWKLIRFEDAVIELDPFVRVHPFETARFLIDGIIEHYTEELKSQAAKILGAVDFLGNPLGLVNDVSDGISDFINEGDVGGLFKNVAHGLSDSAAKVTGSLSESLGLVAMDDHHQQVRKRIKQDNIAAGSDHLVAGLKGLGYGILGGVTSVFTQTYEGAATEGVQGFFAGLGKGLVGTVTKPAVGFLDLATGAAVAVRDTSRRSSHAVPERCRLPRVCFSPGGLLPQYNREQSDGQQVFFSISCNSQERFVSRHWLRRTEGMELLITDEYVFVINRNIPSGNTIILKVPFNELFNCSYVQSQAGEIRHYIQLIMKSETPVGIDFQDQPSKRPQVRCDTQAIAQRVVEEINYIRELYEERFYKLVTNEAEDVDDDHL